MADKKLRAGVIGCGLGASHGYAYAHAPDYDLVAICDIKPEVFDRFYERSGLPKGVYHEYTDYHEMFKKENLDVVSVATPDDYHANPVCDASNAGVKGIFCEKPLTINLKDADRMLSTVERNGTKMSVDHTRSWIPSYQTGRKLIREGELGGLTRIVAHMGGHRSMLFRNGTHLIDAVCFFADADPLWVIAAHERGFENYGPEYKGQGGKDPMLDPGSSLIIEFANGVRAVVNSAKNTPAIFEFDLQGPMGRLLINDKDGSAWKAEKPEGALTQVPAPWIKGYQDVFGENLIPAVQEIAQMIWNDAPSSSPPRRALNTLEIMTGALISQTRDSGKVHLPLPRS
ncbi:MAG: Gfo/Idh/MocA family oxidoreductase [Chloroflexi bacterium]|nr:Gfo/Idh/MocA family oxidoreductase [Chloroflexota bacterium]